MERSRPKSSRSSLATNMRDCSIKGASGSSWYPGHTAFITSSNSLKMWTASPGPLAWIISDVGRLYRRGHLPDYSVHPWRAYALLRLILRCPGQKSWTLPSLPNGITLGDVIYTVVDLHGAVQRRGSCVQPPWHSIALYKSEDLKCLPAPHISPGPC